jgi:hypothetical protein
MPWIAEHLNLHGAANCKRQQANPPPPSATAGACPKTPKVDGSIKKCCMTSILPSLFFHADV